MNSIYNYGTDHLTIGICLDIASGKTKGIIGDDAQAAIRAPIATTPTTRKALAFDNANRRPRGPPPRIL